MPKKKAEEATALPEGPSLEVNEAVASGRLEDTNAGPIAEDCVPPEEPPAATEPLEYIEPVSPASSPDDAVVVSEEQPSTAQPEASELTEAAMELPVSDASTASNEGDELSRILAEMDSNHLGAEGSVEEDAPVSQALPPEEPPAKDVPPTKPKRASRRKKTAEPEGSSAGKEVPLPKQPTPPHASRPRAAPESPGVLTIEARAAVLSEEDQEEAAWHEIRNAYRTRRILSGTIGGIEQLDNGKTVVIVEYKGFRVIIPLKEMMLHVGRSPTGGAYNDLIRRQNQILSTMLGAEIDFIVCGIETKSRSIVASRKDAMLKKRQIFYLDTDEHGEYRIYNGRVVQARVIAVAEKVIRVEAFGAECSILARDLAWDWIGDAHERFSVGDQILVRILEVQRGKPEDITIRADVRSVSSSTDLDNLKKCRIQSKYAGRVTDVRKGVVYLRLANGVNAIAHACYDRRMPGKKDDVSFAVTHIDEEFGVAVGIITRIIKQNL